MPTWTKLPPERGEGPALPIRRTPPQGSLIGVITSDEMIGTDTHFYGGHTVPCERPDCEACLKGVPFRWHGYVAAIDLKNHLHFIFEMTAAAAEPFKDYKLAHGSLRGCKFGAERLHRRPNGRVIIRTTPADLANVRLPKPPDLINCMSIIWQIPSPDVQLAGRLKGVDHVVPLATAKEIHARLNNRPA